ncbi:MAG: glycerol-3-phosphate 1-O-acyltransferase PlsY [Pseudomonadota bacterium]
MGWERAWPELLEAFGIAYLIGSIPFGILISALFGLGDLRKVGSGNIGATNVLRTGSKAAAALTLLLDMLKGLLPVWWFLTFEGDLAAQAAAIGAVLGHCLPVWLRFRGGKGVATFLGTMLGLSFFSGAAVCATWLAGAALTRISSAAAMISAASAPVWLFLLDGPRAVLCSAVLAVWVILRHHENIARLIAGTEPRIGKGGKAGSKNKP